MIDIQSSQDAACVITSAVNAHAEIWESIDNIEDYIIRRKKPFNEKELVDNGYHWSANFNYNKGASKIEQTIWKNIADLDAALAFIEVHFRAYNPEEHRKQIYAFLVDDRLLTQISFAIAKVFGDTLEFDTNFHAFASKIEYNAFAFGHCSVTRDNKTYLGYPNHVRNIAYEDRTKLDEIRTWVLFDNTKAELLYSLIQDILNEGYNYYVEQYNGCTNTFYENGWCKEGLLEIFGDRFNGKKYKYVEDGTEKEGEFKFDKTHYTWENIQFVIEKIGFASFIYDVNRNNVYIAKIFYFDCEDNFCETYVVTQGDQNQRVVNGSYIGVNKHLLYRKNHGKLEQGERINVIRDIGISVTDYIHELRGAAKFIAEDSLRFDIKKCAMEDKLMIAGSPVIKEVSSMEGNAKKMAVTAGFVYIPEGVNLEPAEFRFDLSSQMESIALDEANFQRETFHYDPNMDLSSRPTSDEVQSKQAQVFRQRSSKTPVKLSDYSVLFKNILKDISQEKYEDKHIQRVQNFFFDELQKELIHLDLSKEDLKTILAEISHITLSPVNSDVAAIREALTIAQSPASVEKLRKMFLLALGFSRRDVNSMISEQSGGFEYSVAGFENTDFFTTSEVSYYSSQDHILHLTTHFAKLDRVIQGIAGGEDIVKGFNFVTNCLQNTEKHVEAIRANPFYKRRYKEFDKIQKFFVQKAKQISDRIKQIQKQAAAQAQAQSQQNGQGNPEQLTAKEQHDIYLDRIKLMDKIQRTNRQSEENSARRDKELNFRLEQAQKMFDQKASQSEELANMKKDLEMLKASVDITKSSNANRGTVQPSAS